MLELRSKLLTPLFLFSINTQLYLRTSKKKKQKKKKKKEKRKGKRAYKEEEDCCISIQ